MLAIILQATGLYVISMICLFAILFPVAHCLFLITFTLDLHDDISILNDGITIQSYSKKKKFSANRCSELNKTLYEIIEFQCDLKQLSILVSGYTYYGKKNKNIACIYFELDVYSRLHECMMRLVL